MKKKIGIFSLALLLFLLSNAPATLLLPVFNNFEGLKISTIKGTIWQGQATSNYFQKMSWNFAPLDLLFAQLGAYIKININRDNFIKTHANISLFGNTSLNDISAVLSTDYLQKFTPANTPIMLKTTFKIQQAQANLAATNYFPSDAKGIIIAKKAVLLGEELGDYHLDFELDDNILTAKLKSLSAANVGADVAINMNENRILKISGNIKPKEKNLKMVFKELNIANKLNYQFNLKRYLGSVQ